MSLQRQHFLLSYLKTLSVGPAGFEPETLRSADRRSSNWANQAAVFFAVLNMPIILYFVISILLFRSSYSNTC